MLVEEQVKGKQETKEVKLSLFWWGVQARVIEDIDRYKFTSFSAFHSAAMQVRDNEQPLQSCHSDSQISQHRDPPSQNLSQSMPNVTAYVTQGHPPS